MVSRHSFNLQLPDYEFRVKGLGLGVPPHSFNVRSRRWTELLRERRDFYVGIQVLTLNLIPGVGAQAPRTNMFRFSHTAGTPIKNTGLSMTQPHTLGPHKPLRATGSLTHVGTRAWPRWRPPLPLRQGLDRPGHARGAIFWQPSADAHLPAKKSTRLGLD